MQNGGTMKSRRCCYLVPVGVVALVMLELSAAPAGAADCAKEVKEYEDIGAAKFDHPTAITNEWLPLRPGTRFTWDGSAVDEEGDSERHSSTFTVTDLTKVIGGVPTV